VARDFNAPRTVELISTALRQAIVRSDQKHVLRPSARRLRGGKATM
jgi:hypothetical protein